MSYFAIYDKIIAAKNKHLVSAILSEVLLNIVLQPLRFLSILNRFMVNDLNVFQVVFNYKQV
jgi:hypothetical protein